MRCDHTARFLNLLDYLIQNREGGEAVSSAKDDIIFAPPPPPLEREQSVSGCRADDPDLKAGTEARSAISGGGREQRLIKDVTGRKGFRFQSEPRWRGKAREVAGPNPGDLRPEREPLWQFPDKNPPIAVLAVSRHVLGETQRQGSTSRKTGLVEEITLPRFRGSNGCS